MSFLGAQIGLFLAFWAVFVLAQNDERPIGALANGPTECEPCKVETCRTPSSIECVAGELIPTGSQVHRSTGPLDH